MNTDGYKKYGGCIFGGIATGCLITALFLKVQPPVIKKEFVKAVQTVNVEKTVFVDREVVKYIQVQNEKAVSKTGAKKTTEFRKDGTVLRISEENFNLGVNSKSSSSASSSESEKVTSNEKTHISTSTEVRTETSVGSLERYHVSLGLARPFSVEPLSWRDGMIYGSARLGDSRLWVDLFLTGRLVLGGGIGLSF